jgi:2'-5' RNA ligase
VRTGGRTALVVVMREAEDVLAPVRRRHLRSTVDRGIPAHVTILFPFVQARDVGPTLVDRLRALFAPVEPFGCELARVDSFPGYAWLAPEPADRFLELMTIAHREFPDLPPYGDAAIDPIPHCTVGAADEPERLAEIVVDVRAALAPRLPIACAVEAVTILEELGDETWLERETVPLGRPG